jgi:glutathione reductase (NADPH)
VTVLQRAERTLTRFEPELVGWLMEKFAEIGVEVRTGTPVDRVSGVSFAEQMLGDPAAIPQRLQILVRLRTRYPSGRRSAARSRPRKRAAPRPRRRH